MIVNGERQIAPSLDGIRRDHVARYEWAAKYLGKPCWVVDFACGIGYGTAILSDAGHTATGFDKSIEAIQYGRKFYARPGLTLHQGDANDAHKLERDGFDAAVCFETIEHVEDPRILLRALRAAAPLLLASVPNEDVIPFGPGFAFHHRHYTKGEFANLLGECGWQVESWWGQEGSDSEVEPNVNGRTLIAVARRKENHMAQQDLEKHAREAQERMAKEVIDSHKPPHVLLAEEMATWEIPEHVAILGLGPSLEQYVDIVKRMGGKHAYCTEVWGINAVAGVLMCDRVFHMDDVRVQEVRAAALPESNIARMLEWLKVHPGPIITSRAHPDYPGLVEFPLEEVLNQFKFAYFNSTAAYAVAYAIWLGVKKISMFGCDFTYPNSHDAEKGRACVEFWLAMAAARGIQLTISTKSTLMDAIHTQADRIYGYDTLDLTLRVDDAGYCHVDKVPRDELPSAEEIEAKYDHSRHPNVMVEQSER